MRSVALLILIIALQKQLRHDDCASLKLKAASKLQPANEKLHFLKQLCWPEGAVVALAYCAPHGAHFPIVSHKATSSSNVLTQFVRHLYKALRIPEADTNLLSTAQK